MLLDQISNGEAALAVLAIIGFAVMLYRAIPAGEIAPKRRSFTEPEITAYDASLPKYLITATAVLVIGATHTVIKTLPPVYAWLARAGHAGHLVRDIANSHLVIVLGGTIAATGLTWYVLPRIARRPLWSPRLANLSFWCTLIGASGFYVSNIVLGVAMGRHVIDGTAYDVVKSSFGAAYAIPVGLSSTIMGVGYWTFTLVAIMTIIRSRDVEEPKPLGHLLKFFAVGALGLFVGTVQGVVQVMPAQAEWLHETGAAGHFIDPIAHAHVNLVTGMLVLIAGVCFAWSSGVRTQWRERVEQRGFWLLVPASLLFYLVFLRLGFLEGGIMLRRGVDFEAATDIVGWPHTVSLLVAGTLTLVGTWAVLLPVLRRYWPRGSERRAGAALVALGVIGLLFGTMQGLIQLAPSVKGWLEAAGDLSDVPNAHAQLNMLGGVLPIMFGLALIRSRELLGRAVPEAVVARAAPLVGAGVAVYYLGAMATSLVIGQQIATGSSLDGALETAGPLLPSVMAVGAVLYGVGYWAVAGWVWDATAEHRVRGRRQMLAGLRAYDSRPSWLSKVPRGYFLAAEAVSASVGFPGLGWMMTGRSLAGLPASLAGGAIAWALIPMLTPPGSTDRVIPLDTGTAVLLYLGTTTAISVLALAISLGTRTSPTPQQELV